MAVEETAGSDQGDTAWQLLLRPIAREIGRFVPKNCRHLLLEKLQGSDLEKSAFARGYLLAFKQVLAADAPEEANAAEKSIVADMAQRIGFSRFLRHLGEGRATPGEISESMALDPGHVSRQLKAMRVAKLVKVSQVRPDRRRRRYELTELGRQVLAHTISQGDHAGTSGVLPDAAQQVQLERPHGQTARILPRILRLVNSRRPIRDR